MIKFQAKLRALVVISGLGWAALSSGQTADRYDDLSEAQTYWKELINGQRELTDSMLESSTQRILTWASEGRVGSRFELAQAEANLLIGIVRGTPSALFPEVTRELASQIDQHPLRSFGLGGAFYQNKIYPEAIHYYGEAAKNASPGSQLFYLSSLNLSACHNELGQLDSAIIILQKALETSPSETREEQTDEWLEKYFERIRINLGALQVSSLDFGNALETLHELDTSVMDEYWSNLLWYNTFLAHEGLGEFEKRDSIWTHHLQHISPGALPQSFHTKALHQLLIERDYVDFLQFKTAISELEEASELTQDASPYAALWDTSLSESEAFDLFQLHVIWAENEDQIRLKRIRQEIHLNQNRLSEMEVTLESMNRKNQTILYGASGAFLVVFAGIMWVIYRIRSKRLQRAEAVDLVLNEQPSKEIPVQLPIDRSDIRTIGDAISHGRKISDALLVLKKLTSMLDAEAQPQHLLKSLDRIPGIEKLSDREHQVLQYIASGFDAKEISRSLDMAPEYIYNLRSRIRKKLEIPKEISFETWAEGADL